MWNIIREFGMCSFWTLTLFVFPLLVDSYIMTIAVCLSNKPKSLMLECQQRITNAMWNVAGCASILHSKLVWNQSVLIATCDAIRLENCISYCCYVVIWHSCSTKLQILCKLLDLCPMVVGQQLLMLFAFLVLVQLSIDNHFMLFAF